MDFLANQDGVTGKSMSLEGLDWMFYLDDSSKSHLSISYIVLHTRARVRSAHTMVIWVVEFPRPGWDAKLDRYLTKNKNYKR